MSPEAWGATAVAVLVSAILGALGKWAHTILKEKWKKDTTTTVLDHKATAAERKERRVDLEEVAQHLYKAIASRDEDIAELRVEIENIRGEHLECRVQMAEIRADNVNLRRDLRRMFAFLKEHKIDYPDPMDSSFGMEPPRIDPSGGG